MEEIKTASKTGLAVRKFYRGLALMVLNTLVAVMMLNLGLVISARWKERAGVQDPLIIRQYGMPLLKQAYFNMSEESIRQLLTETYTRPYGYESFTQFGEKPFKGRFVNVDKAGFRKSADQGPWPVSGKNYNVFLFGGSTMFGYGVSDDDTVASCLQRALAGKTVRPCKVYNFGKGHYYSTQERILFEQLLTSGAIPDMVLFMDGLNDFHSLDDKPHNWWVISDVMNQKLGIEVALEYSGIKKKFPVLEVVGVLAALTAPSSRGRAPVPAADRTPAIENAAVASKEVPGNKQAIERAVNRYLGSIKAIDGVASAYGIRAVFVWQPVPTYKYDLQYHLFAGTRSNFTNTVYCSYGYEYLKQLHDRQPAPVNFISCSDMQEGLKENLYVDKIHYSPRMSDLLAQRITAVMVERHLVGGDAQADSKARLGSEENDK